MARVSTPASRRRQRTDGKGVINLRQLILGITVVAVLLYVSFFWAVFRNVEGKAPGRGATAVLPGGDASGGETSVHHLHKEHEQDQLPPREEAKHDGVTIGYAVTITGCGSDPITEGAAVLKHSIHLASSQGNLGGRYNYKMYAIYHPDGKECAEPLADLGYELLERFTPVAVKDIQGDFLREHIHSNGCCGEKELVKLEAYTLIQHPVIVHMDLDTLILKPLDAIFDWMLFQGAPADADTSNVPIMWPEMERPSQVNAFFTRDCAWSELNLDHFACLYSFCSHFILCSFSKPRRQYGRSFAKIQASARWLSRLAS
jgi:hypothetical protein